MPHVMIRPLCSKPRTNELPTALFLSRLGMGVGVTVRVWVGVLVTVGEGVAVCVAVGVASETGNDRVTLVAAAYVVPPMVPPG